MLLVSVKQIFIDAFLIAYVLIVKQFNNTLFISRAYAVVRIKSEVPKAELPLFLSVPMRFM